MERDFAAAAQRHAERRRHHRHRSVLDGHVGLLERIYRGVQLVPIAFLRGQQHQHQVGAHTEILALVGNDHRLKITRGFFDPRANQSHLIAADGVHLAVKLQAHDAVADVDERRPRIPLHHAARALDIGEHQNARPIFECLIAPAACQIEILGVRTSLAIRGPVERFHAGREHPVDVLRDRPLFLHAARRGFEPDCVP